MIKFITTLLVLGVGIAMSPSAMAQNESKDKKKAQRFFKKLKQIPNASGRPGKVTTLAKKLVRLNPTQAKRYYKTATVKYLSAFVERKTFQLTNAYRRILETAANQGQISPALGNRLTRVVEKIEERIILRNEPAPTPTPYQASRMKTTSLELV